MSGSSDSPNPLILTHIFTLLFNGLPRIVNWLRIGSRTMDKKLEGLIAKARKRKMTPKELEAQQVSFAYGNAPKGSKTTKKSVRAALRFTSPTRAAR